jgi:hypothetical protein
MNGLRKYPRAKAVFSAYHNIVINFEFDEKTYQEFLEKREYPSNTRIRPEGVSLLDVLITEQERMLETEEGKRLFDFIGAL